MTNYFLSKIQTVCITALLSLPMAVPLYAEPLAKVIPLCGDINSLEHVPSSDAAFQFAVDSNTDYVALLPSPDGRYVIVLRHGECDSTYIGVWDSAKKRPYGNQTVSLKYGTNSVCWDPKKPIVYFFSIEDIGYPGGSGIYKWEFKKNPNKPVQLDSSAIIRKHFGRNSIDAKLLAIDEASKYLLVNIESAYNGGDVSGESYRGIDRQYIFNMSNSRFLACAECTRENWTKGVE